MKLYSGLRHEILNEGAAYGEITGASTASASMMSNTAAPITTDLLRKNFRVFKIRCSFRICALI